MTGPTDPTRTTGRLEPVRDALHELVPVLRRAVTLEPDGIARLRLNAARATVFVRLPFGVLVSRAVTYDGPHDIDTSVRSAELLEWLDGARSSEPESRDAQWRTGLPPVTGWQRIDAVPDDVVRDLVRQGALALKDAAAREGVPEAQPRAEVADALLDSVVLTVSSDGPLSAGVTLRVLSSLTRMGFLPRGSHIAVAVSGRWTRVAAEYGSVYTERPGFSLNLS
jgi:hypothetical protein